MDTEMDKKNEWINKMWNIHTIKHYSASERKEIQTTAWMNLESLCSVKEASHKGPEFVRSYLCEISRIVKSIETENKKWLPGAEGKGMGS